VYSPIFSQELNVVSWKLEVDLKHLIILTMRQSCLGRGNSCSCLFVAVNSYSLNFGLCVDVTERSGRLLTVIHKFQLLLLLVLTIIGKGLFGSKNKNGMNEI